MPVPFLASIGLTADSRCGKVLVSVRGVATPRRERVLLAKVAVVAAFTLPVAAIATAGMFLAAQMVFRAYGLDTASLADADALRAIVASSVLAPVFPVIAVALGVILRSTAAAIVTVLAFIFAPGIVGAFLPSWWQENVVAYLPGSATDSIAISHLTTETEIRPGVAAVVLVGWLAAFIAAGYAVFAKRDA